MKKFVIAAAVAAFGLAAQAKDIVDTAVAAGSFKTLATAHGRIGMWASDGTNNVECVFHIRHPVAHGLIQCIF